MFGSSSNLLAKRQQSAREGEVEKTALDEDQEIKYNEIIDLLLAGGYFRARIAGLSPFDKVVGGMSWCITASNEDLDIDLLFQEEASIGQKIKLAENIIRALKRMKCPYPLEANQIQGGANTADFVNIFPIIQWLVKKVIETREETGDLMRLFSESQFGKNHKLPEDQAFEERKTSAVSFVEEVEDRYRPNRKYKRSGRRVSYLNRKTKEENVQSALLEYGEYYLTAKSTQTKEKSDIEKQLEKSLGGKGGAPKDSGDDEERRRHAELKKEMSEYVSSGRVDKDIVGGLLPTNIDELESQYQYDESMEGLDPAQAQQRFGAKLHDQQVSKLQREIAEQKSQMNTLKKKYEESDEQLKEIQALHNKGAAYNQRIIQELSKLDGMETPENTKQLSMLKTLVLLNENLKAQEAKFKANCKRQLASLKEQIEKIKKETSSSGADGPNEAELVNQTYLQTLEKLKKIKQLIAKRNRDIALVERKIDEVPERSELGQYQRQFVELYEQVATKFTETRQYYNTYNTLEDTKTYLSKELSILNSINDGYKNAMSSKQGRDQFIESLNTILKSVQQSLEKIDQRANTEKDSKQVLSDKHSSLVEKERLYFKTTKDFLEECRKNEALQGMLDQ